eukprot:g1812.t1
MEQLSDSPNLEKLVVLELLSASNLPMQGKHLPRPYVRFVIGGKDVETGYAKVEKTCDPEWQNENFSFGSQHFQEYEDIVATTCSVEVWSKRNRRLSLSLNSHKLLSSGTFRLASPGSEPSNAPRELTIELENRTKQQLALGGGSLRVVIWTLGFSRKEAKPLVGMKPLENFEQVISRPERVGSKTVQEKEDILSYSRDSSEADDDQGQEEIEEQRKEQAAFEEIDDILLDAASFLNEPPFKGKEEEKNATEQDGREEKKNAIDHEENRLFKFVSEIDVKRKSPPPPIPTKFSSSKLAFKKKEESLLQQNEEASHLFQKIKGKEESLRQKISEESILQKMRKQNEEHSHLFQEIKRKEENLQQKILEGSLLQKIKNDYRMALQEIDEAVSKQIFPDGKEIENSEKSDASFRKKRLLLENKLLLAKTEALREAKRKGNKYNIDSSFDEPMTRLKGQKQRLEGHEETMKSSALCTLGRKMERKLHRSVHASTPLLKSNTKSWPTLAHSAKAVTVRETEPVVKTLFEAAYDSSGIGSIDLNQCYRNARFLHRKRYKHVKDIQNVRETENFNKYVPKVQMFDARSLGQFEEILSPARSIVPATMGENFPPLMRQYDMQQKAIIFETLENKLKACYTLKYCLLRQQLRILGANFRKWHRNSYKKS